MGSSALRLEYVEMAPKIEEPLAASWAIAPDLCSKNDLIGELLSKLGDTCSMGPSRLFRYRLVVDEALTNSVTHGCPIGSPQTVHVALHLSDDAWVVRIEDAGPGFDPESLPDPTDPDMQFLDHGRGLLILERYARRVVYSDAGRVVTIWMVRE